MKKILLLTVLCFIAVQISAQIIPHVELDYISTVSGKKYSGIIVRNDADTVTIKVAVRKIKIAKSQIDTLEKRELELPFIPNSPYSEITLATLNRIQGHILEYNYFESIKFKDIDDDKIYDLKWQQFTDLKTMDPEYFGFDIIVPLYGKEKVKGKFISVTDKKRFIFENEKGDQKEYYFQNIKSIYLREPDKFQLPGKFQKNYSEQKPVRSFLLVGGGLSMGIGSYEDKANGSKAEMGFNVNADMNIPISKYLLFDLSFSYQTISNNIDEKDGWKFDSKDWWNFWILGGPMLFFNTDQNFSYLSVQGGILMPNYPEITYSSTYKYSSKKTYTITGDSDGKFAMAFGAGVGNEKFLFSVKYLTAKPEFTIHDTYFTGGQATTEIEVSTLTIGFGFRL